MTGSNAEQAISQEKYVSVATFRKTGVAVATATWIVPLDGGRAGLLTSSASGKAKRLRNNPSVTLQPSDVRGRVKADTTPVTGTLGGGGRDRLAAAMALAVVRDLLSEKLDPARGSPFTPRAGMVPAADPGDPSAWGVNEKLAYRQCAGWGSKVIADDRSRMNREWTPARTFYRRRGRHGTYDTAPGPHAPGTYACTECRAGTPAL